MFVGVVHYKIHQRFVSMGLINQLCIPFWKLQNRYVLYPQTPFISMHFAHRSKVILICGELALNYEIFVAIATWNLPFMVWSFSSKLNSYLVYIFEERKGSTGSQKKQEDQTIQQWIGQTNYVYWKKIKINTYQTYLTRV